MQETGNTKCIKSYIKNTLKEEAVLKSIFRSALLVFSIWNIYSSKEVFKTTAKCQIHLSRCCSASNRSKIKNQSSNP
jgi:hypothetical protein